MADNKGKMSAAARITAALLILAALIFIIAYQNRDRSIGGEIVNILSGGAGENGRVVEGYAGGIALPFGKKALLVTTNTLMLMDENGSGKAVDISVPSPAAAVGGDYIIVYDRGGRSFTMYSETKEIYSGKTEMPIIAAKVNVNGYAVIAGEAMGGDTEITVYNPDGKAIYVWQLSSGEFVDVDLCDDNSRMVISSVGNSADELRGELSIVRLDSAERMASGFETDEIYFNVKINRDYTVTALGSERLDLYNSDATRRWSLDYGDRTLLGADISRPDKMIICCGSAASGLMGNSTEIELVNRMGEVTASAVFDGLCEHLSRSGSFFAASAGKRIYVFDEKCRKQKEIVADFGVKGLALFKKGDAAFVLSGSAGSIVK